MSKTVYLAGAITGESYKGCVGWRNYAKTELFQDGIDGLSPLRSKEYLADMHVIADSYEGSPLYCRKGITTRDRWDVSRCDLVLMNLTGTTKVSIGSMIEAGWADAYRKPLILCVESDNHHIHAMLTEIAGFIVEDLESGITIAKALLCS